MSTLLSVSGTSTPRSRSRTRPASNTQFAAQEDLNRTKHDTSRLEYEEEAEANHTYRSDTGASERLRRRGTSSKQYTDQEEQAVIRKFDRRLVLFLAFLYLLSFLDRSSNNFTVTITRQC